MNSDATKPITALPVLENDITEDTSSLVVTNIQGYMPPQGIIRIDSEFIQYRDALQGGTGSITLVALERGVMQTIPTTHDADAVVFYPAEG